MVRLTGSAEQAEDIVQEVFMKLWDDRARLPEIENINAWIFTMAQHKAFNSFRKIMRQELMILELIRKTENLSENNANNLSLKEAEQILAKAIEQLPQQQKLVYQLSREQGLKHEEIARQLNLSPGTVKNHMIRALKTLREQLEHHRGNAALVGLILSVIAGFEV